MLFLLPRLVGGCACPTFDELKVTDPDGVASAELLATVTEAARDFASWTGREGVCVDRIEIVEDAGTDAAGRDAAGRYAGRWIEIEATASSPRSTTFHELCHALDDLEELSWPNRELFLWAEDWTQAEVSLEYRAQQRFADACEPEPFDAYQIALELERECGETLVSERGRFLSEEVWSAYPYPALPERVPVTLERLPLAALTEEGLPSSMVTGGGGGDLFIIYAEADDTVALLRVEPETGQTLARVALDDDGQAYEWALVSGEGEEAPLIVDAGQDTETRAWRYDLDADTLTEVPFPEVLDYWGLRGRVDHGRAVVWALPDEARDEAEPYRFMEVDLSSGAWTSLDIDAFVPHNLVPGGPGLLAARWTEDYDQEVVSLDLETGLVEAWSALDLDSQLLVLPAPEGRLVTASSFQYVVGILQALDPDEGTWTMADDPCGEDRTGTYRHGEALENVPTFIESSEDGVSIVRVTRWDTASPEGDNHP